MLVTSFDIKGWEEVEKLKELLSIKRFRSKMKEAGDIMVEELDNSASRLQRSALHGFRKRFGDDTQLVGSFKAWRFGEGVLQITSDTPYALIHDEGGVIEATKKEKLTVPLPGINLSSEALSTLRKLKKTFVSKSGKAIMLRMGKGEPIAIFALKDSVTMKARGYIIKAERKASPRIEKMLLDMIKEVG
jgi:hypothetical protein